VSQLFLTLYCLAGRRSGSCTPYTGHKTHFISISIGISVCKFITRLNMHISKQQEAHHYQSRPAPHTTN